MTNLFQVLPPKVTDSWKTLRSVLKGYQEGAFLFAGMGFSASLRLLTTHYTTPLKSTKSNVTL
jgi:hypothetical protein